jgi:hypothetical protein
MTPKNGLSPEGESPMENMMRKCLVLASVVFCLAACDDEKNGGPGVDAGETPDAGEDASSTLSTCEILADPSLCWTVAVADLYDCVPDEVGTLSADRTFCSYANGTVIEFQSALPTSTNNFFPDLTVRRADASVCATFRESSGTRQTTAGTITADFFQEPGPKLTLRCNGEVVMTDSFSNVLDCASAGIPLPSWSANLDDTSASLSVGAVGQSSTLFQCNTQP